MNFVLVVQKDTLENNRVKSILKIISKTPDEFVTELQDNHCIEYQLLANVSSLDFSSFSDKVFTFASEYKTNYGKDWYAFDHTALAKVITFFLENDIATINLKTISDIMGFSLSMFPVITKEIIKKDILNTDIEREERPEKLEEQRQKNESDDKEIVEKIEEEDGIINIIETLSELPKRENKDNRENRDKKKEHSRKSRK